MFKSNKTFFSLSSVNPSRSELQLENLRDLIQRVKLSRVFIKSLFLPLNSGSDQIGVFSAAAFSHPAEAAEERKQSLSSCFLLTLCCLEELSAKGLQEIRF